MGTRPAQPTEAEWLQHKTTIGRLYLVEEMPLTALIAEVGNLGLAVTKAQLAYKLKLWGFRRTIDRATWASIDHSVAKREREGKESQVIYRGKRLKASAVEKGRKRHCYKTTLDQFIPVTSPSPNSSTELQIVIHTPQSLQIECNWPDTLPWSRFETKLSQWLSNVRQSGQAFMPRLPQRLGPWSILNILAAPGLQPESTVPHLQASKLSAIIRNVMPEAYPGEYSQRAEALLNGSNQERLQECMKMLFYKLSNNHLDTSNDEEWKISMDILRGSKIMNLKVDLMSSGDITVRGFMSNMFRAALRRIRNSYYSDDSDNDDSDSDDSAAAGALTVVRWLLSMGQSPNTRMLDGDDGITVTPLQSAILSEHLDLVELLLLKGADPNLTLDSELRRSPLELALDTRNISEPTLSMRMADSLLNHGASMDWDHALHLAIRRQHLNIADKIVRRGGSLCNARSNFERSSYGLKYEETALSVAAEVGREATEFVLSRLKLDSPEVMNKIITADVFISAAEAGNDGVIRLLYEISSADPPFNKYDITPLHAAAMWGRLSTCRLLLQLWGPCPADVTQPSPIHLASFRGHQDVVRLFIERGVDIETLYDTKSDDKAGFRWSWNNLRGNDNTFEHGLVTPLQLALMGLSGLYCTGYRAAILLIEAGAQLKGGEVLLAASRGHHGLLLAALVAGGNPNEKSVDGTSTLQWALSSLHTESAPNQAITIANVELLIKKGAILAGGEVVLAILSGNLDLAALFVSHGGTLTDSGETGMTALEAAILSENEACIDFMLPPCSKAYDAGALCAAISTGNNSLTWRLLTNRLSQSQVELNILEATAIALAAMSGDMDLLRKLLENPLCMGTAFLPLIFSSDRADSVQAIPGYDLQKKYFWRGLLDWRAHDRKSPVRGSPLVAAAIAGDTEACCELLRARYWPDRLTWYMVADKNDLAFAQVLISHNQRIQTVCLDYPTAPDVSLASPLIPSIKHHNKELILLLLEAGADVNEHNPNIEFCRSPLQQAVKLGNSDIIDCLLKAGADVNLPPALEYGATALQFAAINGHLGIAKRLLELGALINAPGAALKGGRTALEGAAEWGRLDMIKFLLCHGALTTGAGRLQYVRSIDYAAKEGHAAAEVLLREVRDWLVEDERLLNAYRESRGKAVDWRCVEATDAGEGKWALVPLFDCEDDAAESSEDGVDGDEIDEDEVGKHVAAVSGGDNITEWTEWDIDDFFQLPE